MTDRFYLQDNRSNLGDRLMFWREGGGYTSNVREAEVFTRERAVNLHENRESDIPWPADYVDARTHSAVDMQYVDRSAFGAMPLGDAQCLIQVARRYNGNDIVWLLADGGRGANLDDARVVSCEEARELCMANESYVAWNNAYIDQHVRQVVSCADVNREEALRGTGIKLVKPRRPRKEVVNCHGCGQFLSRFQVYGTDCPNCGADNRP
ncbi:hypothetical protein [Modicisalibacter sp. MOD 31.J]|uniref:hypothetical protein n=1 Tax=Modicisalibacter sp. MOD 31.J TaxID=2831897 RepID=UPI001CCD8B17|nr:hypothetical protein [Modicisalibacter sp. MOD 31.J]MBZ9574596.1 hypothetical protein [Modicisalibacter sp. MOD 31.J]